MAEPARPVGIRIYNRKTHAARDVSPEEFQTLYQGGEWAPRANDEIPVAGPSGELGYVKGAMLGSTLDKSWSVTGHDVVKHAEVVQKHSGLGATLGAGAAGFARGLTLGGSDVIGAAAGGGEWLNEAKEVHPYVSAAGEVAGAVAPILFSGGAAGVEGANIARAGATLARGVEGARGAEAAVTAGRGLVRAGDAARGVLGTVGAPARMAAHAGGLAEAGVRALVGEGGGLATRALTKAAALGARGAVEGGIYGAAGQVSEAALGDHDLNAEKMLAAIGHGALMGAATGGALGAAGEVASAGIAKVAPGLKRIAGERAWKAIAGNDARATKIADKVPGGRQAVVESILRDAGLAATDTAETAAPKIAAWRARAAQGLTDTIAPIAGAEIKVATIVENANKLLATTGGTLGHKGGAAAITSLRDQMVEIAAGRETLPLSELLTQRRELERTINWLGEKPVAKAQQRFGRMLEDTVMDHGEAAAKKMGGTFLDGYKAAKLNYQKAAVADEAVQESARRLAKNRSVSPSDYISGVGGVLTGSVLGGVGGGVGGAALGLANKLARERGNSAIAVTLDRIAGMGIVRQAIADTDRRIAGGVEGFFAATKKRARAHTVGSVGQDTEEEYAARVKQIETLQTEPKRAADRLLPMIDHTPKTAASLTQLATDITAYLAARVPAGHMPKDSLTPQLDKPNPTASDMATFIRISRAANDPLSILDHMKDGTLTSDEVAVVKDKFPKVFQVLQTKITTGLAEQTKPLDPSKETQVRLLFGLRTGILDPSFVGLMQSTISTGSTAPPGPSAAPQGRPSSFTPHTEIRTAAQIASAPK